MIHANKWTDKSVVVTDTLQECEYTQERGTNNIKMDLEEAGYEY